MGEKAGIGSGFSVEKFGLDPFIFIFFALPLVLTRHVFDIRSIGLELFFFFSFSVPQGILSVIFALPPTLFYCVTLQMFPIC